MVRVSATALSLFGGRFVFSASSLMHWLGRDLDFVFGGENENTT